MNDFPVNPKNILIAGLKKFYFIPVEDVLSEPEIYKNKLVADYTFKDGKILYVGYFDKNTGLLNIDDSSATKFSPIKSSMAGTISDNAAALDLLFCEMSCKKFIVFIVDNYKNVRVLGRVDAGATFSFSFSSNDKLSDNAEYKYKFLYESGCVPPISTQITDIC